MFKNIWKDSINKFYFILLSSTVFAESGNNVEIENKIEKIKKSIKYVGLNKGLKLFYIFLPLQEWRFF